MEVRNRNTGTVITVHEFRELFAKEGARTIPVLSEEYITDRGYDVVFEGPQASGGTVYQYSMRQGAIEVGGKWYTKYILGPVFTDGEKTAAEQEAEYKAMKDTEQATSVRRTRTQMLKDSDWTQIADSTADKAAWATHRQALRDVTAQAGFPWTIEWPTQP
jgi:hypothetical protein